MAQWDRPKKANADKGLRAFARHAQSHGSPGCGDAFRSGFLHGLSRGWDLEDCARLGSVMGSFAIEQIGGQNHAPDIDQIHSRYEENFGKFPAVPSQRPAP